MKKISLFMLLVCICAVAVVGGVFGIQGNGSFNDKIDNADYVCNMQVGDRDYDIEKEESLSAFSLSDIFGFDKNKATSTGKYVYLGGRPIGISVRTDGMIITAKVGVVTKDGVVYPLSETDIQTGDVLQSIDGKAISSTKDVANILAKVNGDVRIKVRRGEEVKEYTITPALDSVNKEKKLGMMLQEKINGIGTMTFIDGENGRYAALGHPIKDASGINIRADGGEIYNAVIKSVVKGEVGKAGELSGSFNRESTPIGDIDYNNKFGIFGDYTAFTEGMQKIEVASRDEIVPGKAQIYTTISGDTPSVYDIEIIKVNNQSSADDKSMVIRITDSRLLTTTGGIVQGMSGSPIVQNGKLIGAVTHVLINDPTKGYGIFAEWMLNR